MQAPLKNIFDKILWSSNLVFSATKQLIEQQQYSLHLLPMLHDVDEEKDITFIY